MGVMEMPGLIGIFFSGGIFAVSGICSLALGGCLANREFDHDHDHVHDLP